ncbi:MAG: hypothetical protein Q9180_003805, partial [Flavoplaca navasiana]
MEPSQSYGLQNALTSPARNTWKVGVCYAYPSFGLSAQVTEGVPFHPKDQPPKAPCPLCVRNNQDHAAKILYAIRGTARGEYDDNIPPEYFEFPPQQLNNSGNEALR